MGAGIGVVVGTVLGAAVLMVGTSRVAAFWSVKGNVGSALPVLVDGSTFIPHPAQISAAVAAALTVKNFLRLILFLDTIFSSFFIIVFFLSYRIVPVSGQVGGLPELYFPFSWKNQQCINA